MRLKYSITCLALMLLLHSCQQKNLTSQWTFFPEIIDGISHLHFNNHTSEQLFSGGWSQPIMGTDKHFYRYLQPGEGKIHFWAVQAEKYVLQVEAQSPERGAFIRLKDKTISLPFKQTFIGQDLIDIGNNSISFITSQKFKVQRVSLFPKRILRYKNYKQLIQDKSILFLPGKLRYYLKPQAQEKLLLIASVYPQKKITVDISIRTRNERKNLRRTIISEKSLEIPLIKNEYQEIILKPLAKKGYLNIKKSVLITAHHHSQDDKQNWYKIKKGIHDKNLLIVLLDATRYDHLSHNGYIRPTTPQIDQLVPKYQVFDNAHSQASYTLASTATLLTALPPDYHGVISKDYSALADNTTTLAELFNQKGFYTAAISGNPNFSKAYNLQQGFTSFIELFRSDPAPLAEEFIEPFKNLLHLAAGKSFFIYLHIREPHDPFLMPKPFLGRFQNSFSTHSKALMETGKAFHQSYIDPNHDLDLLRKLYDENLCYGDWAVGQILNILKENKIDNNTVVVFLSDHGEAIGENGVIGHGHVLYETGIHIPLMMKIPGIPGKTYSHPITTSDLTKTLGELFDLEFPTAQSGNGKNIFLQIPERRVFSRSINIHYYPHYSVTQYPYKLIVKFPWQPSSLQLFNLLEDPQEVSPLNNHSLIQKTLFFYLVKFLQNAASTQHEILKPKLRKSDIKALKTLGYIGEMP